MEQLGLLFSPQKTVFTVAEVTSEIRAMLETEFDDLRVSGEVSNCRRAPSGHYYFTLKDGEAQLRCVCFRQNAMYLKVKPADGLEVVARGRISVYEARGEYQLYVQTIEPQGYGALQLAFEQLKKKLAAEGLFDDERKRPIPRMPARIGIVTSPGGAAIADMVRILERRFPGVHVRLHPAQVQGELAVSEIVRGLRWFSENPWADVVIVGRGGGSLEDLWAFNEEPVARAIAASAVPVISAVGHQTDFTIADFVADLRAPTPSAAAELAVPDKRDLVAQVRGLEERAAQAMRYGISRAGRRLLQAGVERPGAVIRRRIQRLWQRNDELEMRLRDGVTTAMRRGEKRLRAQQHRLAELDLRVRLAKVRARLEGLEGRAEPAVRRRLDRATARLDGAARALRGLSPLAILERGYAIVSGPDGSIVRAAAQTKADERLDVRLHEGKLRVRVEG